MKDDSQMLISDYNMRNITVYLYIVRQCHLNNNSVDEDMFEYKIQAN